MTSPHLFGQFMQLGYVVTDLDEVTSKFRDRYGIDDWKIVPMPPGSPLSRLAMAYVGDVMFELVEVDQSVELLEIHRGWLPADPGEARFNHVAFLLDSREEWSHAQAKFAEQGVAVPVSMPFGDIFEFFFADTVSQLGHWSEFLCLGPAGKEFLASVPRF